MRVCKCVTVEWGVRKSECVCARVSVGAQCISSLVPHGLPLSRTWEERPELEPDMHLGRPTKSTLMLDPKPGQEQGWCPPELKPKSVFAGTVCPLQVAHAWGTYAQDTTRSSDTWWSCPARLYGSGMARAVFSKRWVTTHYCQCHQQLFSKIK